MIKCPKVETKIIDASLEPGWGLWRIAHVKKNIEVSIESVKDLWRNSHGLKNLLWQLVPKS